MMIVPVKTIAVGQVKDSQNKQGNRPVTGQDFFESGFQRTARRLNVYSIAVIQRRGNKNVRILTRMPEFVSGGY